MASGKTTNGFTSPDSTGQSPGKSISILNSDSSRGQCEQGWSNCTNMTYDNVERNSLLKRDCSLAKEKSPIPKQHTAIIKSKILNERSSPTKGSADDSITERNCSSGTLEGHGHMENDRNKERILNQKLKEKCKEIKKLQEQVKKLQEQVNNTNLQLQEENAKFVQQLGEANKHLCEAKQLLKVKDEQLKEAEMKLQVYADGKHHFTSDDNKTLLERIKHLEEQIGQNNQQIKDFMECQSNEKIKDLLEEQAQQNMQEMKDLWEEKSLQMKQQMIEQMSKLTTSQQKSEKDTTENKENGFFVNRRVDEKKNQCWRNHVNCLLNEKDFQFVGDRIGGEWKRILRLLDVKEYRIENIEANCENYPAAEKAVQGLISWQRQTPKQAALCTLMGTLKAIERLDIIEELNSNSSNRLKKQIGEMKALEEDDEVAGNEIYIASVDHYVGREEEIKQITQFCEESQGNRLLYINGLPGVGKSEVLLKALSQIDRKNIVQPNFYDREDRMVEWTYQEFLQCVTKAWKLHFNKEVANIRDELLNVKEPRILILEMATFFCEPIVAHNIWRFIYDVTRNNHSKLKVIVTTCKHPEEILICNVPADQIALRGLYETTSIKLLQMLNSKISSSDGKVIFRFFGGNPFLLLKISANIKTFANFEEDMIELIKCLTDYSLKYDYVNRLVKRTEWSQKMEAVLDTMEENERVVLAKLCVFSGPIPKCLLPYIFRDNETKHEADHLYMYHSILELIHNGSAYFLSPIYRVFMKMYVKKDKSVYNTDSGEKILQSIYDDARKEVRKCYIKLLVSLSHMFFSKYFVKADVDRCCDKLVNEYRNRCETCECDACVCSNFVISRAIFGEHKSMIVKSLEETLSYDQSDFMLLSPVNIFVFLKYMSNEHSLKFQDIEEQECTSCEYGDCVFSCYYRILLKSACEKKPLALDLLSKRITVLKEKGVNGSSYQSVLFLLYLARAGVQASTEENQLTSEGDLLSAREIYILSGDDISNKGFACLGKAHIQRFSKGRKLVADGRNTGDIYSLPNLGCNGKFAYIDMAAGTAFQFRKYENAKNLWEIHLKLAFEQLGEEHPFTAKSYYHLGKCQEKLSQEVSLAVGNYEKALMVCSNLKVNDMLTEVSAALKQVKEIQHEAV